MFSFSGTDATKKFDGKAEPSHGDIMLSSIRELRENDIVRDFSIVVEGENFVVHRTVLAACSPYFRAMLSHDTKERDEGIAEMKDVKATAVKQCIDFMYTGITDDVNLDLAGDVIHAATMMQLDKLSDSCFKKIESSLTHENCLGIANFVAMYPCDRLRNKVETFIGEHFNELISAEEFLNLSQCDLTDLLKKYPQNDEIIWKAIINWMRHVGDRNLLIDELRKLLHLEEFPTEDLLKGICEEPLIMTSPARLEIFHRLVFSRISSLECNLTVGNCIIIRNWANTYEHVTKEADDVINKFLLDNFDSVLAKKQFVEVDKNDVLMLFEAKNVDNLASEKLKWISAVRWVKHDIENRKVLFPNLITNINFGRFDHEFIQSVVREETLMKDCDECLNIFMDSIFGKNLKAEHDNIAILSPDTGKIRSSDLENKQWSDVPDISGEEVKEIFSLNKKLCAVTSTGIYYFGESKNWIKKTCLPVRYSPNQHRVLAFDDQIYLVGKENVLRYDLLRDKWDEKISGFGIDVMFCVARLGNFLYVFSETEAKRYNIASSIWEAIEWQSFNAISAAEYLGKIYVFGFQEVRCYDPDHNSWNDISSPGRYGGEISSFSSRDKLIAAENYSGQTRSHAFCTVSAKWSEFVVSVSQSIQSTPVTSGLFGQPACAFGSGLGRTPSRNSRNNSGFSFCLPAATSAATTVTPTQVHQLVFSGCFFSK